MNTKIFSYNYSVSEKAYFYKDIGMVDAIGDGIVIIKGLTNVATVK